MTYLAAVTDWLTLWGPVAWGAVGIAAFVTISLAYYLFSAATAKSALTNYTRNKSLAGAVSVLVPRHENERFSISEFFHPFYSPTSHVQFHNCDILGPGNIVISGGEISNNLLSECEIVIVRDNIYTM